MSNASRVILFGASEAGEKALAKCPEGTEVLAFADNAPSKIGAPFCGHKVIAPEAIPLIEFDLVVIASMYVEAIHEQLLKLGVAKTKIASFLHGEHKGLPEWPFYSSPAEAWEANLDEEVDFWSSKFVSTDGDPQAIEVFRRLATTKQPVRPLWGEYLDKLDAVKVEVLDVGAGPRSVFGQLWEGKEINLLAVDPLADEYNEMIDSDGIEPLVRTEKLLAEELLSRFAPNSFDIVYSRNALDHAIDPVEGVRQMVEVVKHGGYCLIYMVVNEGAYNRYRGLHRWNFMPDGGDLVIWNQQARFSVKDLLGDKVDIELKHRRENERDWVFAAIRKLG